MLQFTEKISVQVITLLYDSSDFTMLWAKCLQLQVLLPLF